MLDRLLQFILQHFMPEKRRFVDKDGIDWRKIRNLEDFFNAEMAWAWCEHFTDESEMIKYNAYSLYRKTYGGNMGDYREFIDDVITGARYLLSFSHFDRCILVTDPASHLCEKDLDEMRKFIGLVAEIVAVYDPRETDSVLQQYSKFWSAPEGRFMIKAPLNDMGWPIRTQSAILDTENDEVFNIKEPEHVLYALSVRMRENGAEFVDFKFPESKEGCLSRIFFRPLW
jgi:hypothetical protein